MLLARPAGSVSLEVWDARSGQPLRGFRYRLHCPGMEPESGEAPTHEATVLVRLGMPSNLRIEAPGYRAHQLRQILLTPARPNQHHRVELTPSSPGR